MEESKVKIEEAEALIKKGLNFLDEKNYPEAEKAINSAYKIFKKEDFTEGISISLSLISFLNYSEKKTDYENSLALAQDGTFLAHRANSISANLINELILGNINFAENNRDIAIIHYNNALKLSVDEDKYQLSDTINTRIRQLQNGMDYSLPTKSDPLVSLVKISRSITAITDIDALLRVIAEETKMQYKQIDVLYFYGIKIQMNYGQKLHWDLIPVKK